MKKQSSSLLLALCTALSALLLSLPGFAQDEQSDRSVKLSDVRRVLNPQLNYYDLFETPAGETPDPNQLRRKLRQMKILFHPDLARGSAGDSNRALATPEEAAKALDRILIAEETLKDEGKRYDYDVSIGLISPRTPVQRSTGARSRSSEPNSGADDNIFGFATARPAAPLNEDRVRAAYEAISKQLDLNSYVSRISQREDNSMSGDYLEGLVRFLRDEADRRARGEAPEKKSAWRTFGGLRDSNGFKAYEAMEPVALDKALTNSLVPAESAALVHLLVMSKIDPVQDRSRQLKEALQIFQRASGNLIQAVMARPLAQTLLDDATVQLLIDVGPPLAKEMGFGSYQIDSLLRSVVASRLVLLSPSDRPGRELVLQTELLAANGWTSLVPHLNDQVQTRVLKLLKENPNLGDRLETYLENRIKELQAGRARSAQLRPLETLLGQVRAQKPRAASAENKTSNASPDRSTPAQTSTAGSGGWRQKVSQMRAGLGRLFRGQNRCESVLMSGSAR